MNKQILRLRLQGYSYKQIAENINIGKTTVGNRLKKIYADSTDEIRKKLDYINLQKRTTKIRPATDTEILQLRLQNMTAEEIAEKLNYSRVSIEKRLKKIFDNADADLKTKLLKTKETVARKIRISIFQNVTPYQLGIIWGVGNYNGSEMFFRSRHRYFLEQLEPLTDSDVFSHIVKDKKQYKLKTALFDIEELKNLGWTERNADVRDIPVLDDAEYKDFVRAYMELHSTLMYRTVRNRKGKKTHKVLRFRIYGNELLIRSINQIFYEFADVPKKNLGMSKNGKTATMSYAKLDEIISIFRFVEGEPCYQKFWEDAQDKLNNPKVPIGNLIDR